MGLHLIMLGSLGTLLDSLNNWRRKCSSFGFNLYTKCCRTLSRSAPAGDKNLIHLTVSRANQVFAISTQPVTEKTPLLFSLRWQCPQFFCDFLRLACFLGKACVSHYPSPSLSTPFWLGNLFLISCGSGIVFPCYQHHRKFSSYY